MVVKIVLTFLMTPMFVKFLGNYDYGLWEMVGAVLGYMGMLDLGIRPAISVFAAKYRAKEDTGSLRIVYASTLVFMFCLGVLLATILAVWGLLFSGNIAPEIGETAKYTLFMLILAGQMLIVTPGYVAESFLDGFQKYYLMNNITIVNSLLGAGLFISYATPENALLLLAGINAIGLGIKYLMFFALLARPIHGALNINLKLFSPAMLSEMLRFSFKSFIYGVSTRMESFTDTLVIGFFMGPTAVPFYSIPQNLVRYIQTLGWTMSHPFLPLFSDLATRSKQEAIKQIYLVASKFIAGLILAMGVGAIILATPFLALWIGSEYTEQSDIIVFLLVFFIVLPALNPFCNRYLTAINRHGIFARLSPISAVANLVLSIFLVEPYGIVGVAAASVIPGLFLQPMLLVYTCRQLELPVSEYIKTSLLPLILPLTVMGSFVVTIRLQMVLDSYSLLVATVVGGAILYFSCFWFFSLTSGERHFIKERFRMRFF